MEVMPENDDCCRAHLDLTPKEARIAQKFRPGQVIKILLVGEICCQSFDKVGDIEDKGYNGRLTLDVTEIQISESARNQIAELFDDEDV